jgi:hypothetical protein
VKGVAMAGVLGSIVAVGEYFLNPRINGDLHGMIGSFLLTFSSLCSFCLLLLFFLLLFFFHSCFLLFFLLFFMQLVDCLGEAYLFQRREAFDRYKMLAEKHKVSNDAILLNLERESFSKLDESGRS